jgi:NAD(P)-dependent dehydrogenase (short-subunit alcohol dehydrogenase family)
MFSLVKDQLGSVDILVNNSGIFPKADLINMTELEWDETLDINLKGVFLCTQAAVNQMLDANKGGTIVNIGSIEGLNPAMGHCHYSSSKAGVAMFGMNAALELGKYNIRVNTVSPGLINSPTLASDWPDGVNRWHSRCPLKRLGEPEDIADACLFFASDASRWITGTQLVVDGGVLTNQIY